MDKLKEIRARRKKSIRKKIFGTNERPRMCLHKSNKNVFVQIVNDLEGKTLCGLSTLSPKLVEKNKTGTHKNMNFAEMLGKKIAELAIEKGIKKIVFDRGGYRYHGVVKKVADTARKQGLEF